MNNQSPLPAKLGSKNAYVGHFQSALNKWIESSGASLELLKVDGVFGPKTEAVVKAFQAANNLLVDGVIGRNTFGRLVPVPERPVEYKRHNILLLEPDEVVNRALMTVGAPIKYHLEYPNGGTDPLAAGPADEQTQQLDCSGANAFWQGYDRDFMDGMSATLDKWDGYANTDSKIKEARDEGKLFTIIAAGSGNGFLTANFEDIQLGDMIIGESFDPPGDQKRKIGHEGTIVGLDKVATRGLGGIAVVHCSPSNVKLNEANSAVWKTNAKLWAVYSKWYIVRFNRTYAHDRLVELRSK